MTISEYGAMAPLASIPPWHHIVIIQSRHHYICNIHGFWMCQKQCHTKETVIISFSQWSCHLSVLVNKHEDDSWDKRVVTLSVDIWVVESRALPIGWVWPPLHICSTDRRRKGHKTPSVSLQWNWIETKILKLGLMIRGSKIWLVLFNQIFDWGKIGIQIKSISKHINVCYII